MQVYPMAGCCPQCLPKLIQHQFVIAERKGMLIERIHGKKVSRFIKYRMK